MGTSKDSSFHLQIPTLDSISMSEYYRFLSYYQSKFACLPHNLHPVFCRFWCMEPLPNLFFHTISIPKYLDRPFLYISFILRVKYVLLFQPFYIHHNLETLYLSGECGKEKKNEVTKLTFVQLIFKGRI